IKGIIAVLDGKGIIAVLDGKGIIAVLDGKGIIAVLDGMSTLSGRKSVPGIVAVNWENGKKDYPVLT
nr:hypothetical protein [Tanacetum cinerariifolium]